MCEVPLEMDTAEMIGHRPKMGREIETNLVSVFQTRAAMEDDLKTKEQASLQFIVDRRLCGKAQEVFSQYVGKEVPVHLRRTGGFAAPDVGVEDRSKLVGQKKGVGGVVEILKQKYGCSKGERYRVIGERCGPAGLWRLASEPEKTIPKMHLKQGGWRWVVEGEVETNTDDVGGLKPDAGGVSLGADGSSAPPLPERVKHNASPSSGTRPSVGDVARTLGGVRCAQRCKIRSMNAMRRSSCRSSGSSSSGGGTSDSSASSGPAARKGMRNKTAAKAKELRRPMKKAKVAKHGMLRSSSSSTTT
eukprot:CAMPEP_0117541668 /NCGR_PEP_ID=MMETSP0784-20121206/44138_1 /TAXON_ID=39447 /ORGANISM="" /LENGTH=302 /DNA_ID=CAMNT_0005338371 /DNA_START=108 /DNA_END=1012 /DNA_ORIENTATION=+